MKVFYLLENICFDSKYHFGNNFFLGGQKCHIPSKNYITRGINSFGEIEHFFEKCGNLIANFGKNDSWF